MKRIALFILAAVMVLALSACGTDPLYNNTSETDAAAEKETVAEVNKDDYDETFAGMQKYLIAMDLLPSDDKSKTETFAEVLGAKNGVRYTLSSSAFIEFYEYTDKKSDEAKAVLDQVEANGQFEVAGLDPLTAVMSDSGKYMAAYNDKLSYDKYADIIAAFKEW